MVGGLDELRSELKELTRQGEKPARLRRLFFAGLLVAGWATACGQLRDQPPPGSADSGAPLARADSIPSTDLALAQFRAGLPRVFRLANGAASRDELVADFIRAVERNDTSAVQRMHISRAEYAYLYFPTSIYMREPYRQPPAIAWLLSSQASEKGISRVMQRLGGQQLGFQRYECGEDSREGENRFWRSCAITYRDPRGGVIVTRRLFGAIIERGGRYKILSYANDF